MRLKSGTVETGPNLCNEKPFPFLYLNCYNIYLIACGNLDYNNRSRIKQIHNNENL